MDFSRETLREWRAAMAGPSDAVAEQAAMNGPRYVEDLPVEARAYLVVLAADLPEDDGKTYRDWLEQKYEQEAGLESSEGPWPK